MRCRNEHSKRFPTPRVKSPQEEEKKEMKYTLAFHAEGKKFFLRTVDSLVVNQMAEINCPHERTGVNWT